MKVIICTCNDQGNLDLKEIRLFLKSKEDVDDVKIYKELCEDEQKETRQEIKDSYKKTLIAACPRVKDIVKSRRESGVEFLDINNLVYSVNKDKKIENKVKKLLAEKIEELREKEVVYSRDNVDEKDILTMDSGINLETSNYMSIDREHCASTDEWNCVHCKVSCPKDLFNEKKMAVDKRECDICGICSNNCPLNLIEIGYRKNISSLIETILSSKQNERKIKRMRNTKEKLNNEIILFSCEDNPQKTLEFIGKSELEYSSEILPISVPCISMVSINNILDVFANGGEGVILMGCDDCYNESQGYIKNILDRFNDSFENTALEGRVKYISTDGGKYKEINEELNRFSSKISEEVNLNLDLPKKDLSNEALEKYDTTERKKFLLRLKRLSNELEISEEKIKNLLIGFVPEIEPEKCSGCGRCVDNCSTEAIQRNDELMVIQEWKCIGCDKCIDVCPEDAIDLKDEFPSIKNNYQVIS